ncbi:MAG: type II toxin-antitoxin system RelE/ParE family toxin [Acidobacteria bacterium]|nr:type II toxin-antitoxin system RelE/ParE family toxin [Acidobacteriota bacterium]
MTRISWTLQALDDVESIRRYVARDSEEYASLLVARFLQAVERLPVSGRIVPEVGDAQLREVISGSYRIVYRVLDDEVVIVTVHHGARLLRFT